jgi:transposase InsO family protein
VRKVRGNRRCRRCLRATLSRRVKGPDQGRGRAGARPAPARLQRDPPEREVGLRRDLPRTWTGFVYLAFILDCFSRMIVGWQLATNLRADLVLDALERWRVGCTSQTPA